MPPVDDQGSFPAPGLNGAVRVMVLRGGRPVGVTVPDPGWPKDKAVPDPEPYPPPPPAPAGEKFNAFALNFGLLAGLCKGDPPPPYPPNIPLLFPYPPPPAIPIKLEALAVLLICGLPDPMMPAPGTGTGDWGRLSAARVRKDGMREGLNGRRGVAREEVMVREVEEDLGRMGVMELAVKGTWSRSSKHTPHMRLQD